MLVIRPITDADFAALQEFAIKTGSGFTSLPNCDDKLSSKIHLAAETFKSKSGEPRLDKSYLFVLEDLTTGKVCGLSGIEADVGSKIPMYHFRESRLTRCSASLNMCLPQQVINLCTDYQGVSEVCSLFLLDEYRKGGVGRLLSQVRFLFMAEHPERFSDTIIAEMRGYTDETGESPFWKWINHHFLPVDFAKVDHFVGTGKKDFISELMPTHPIYLSLIDEEARDAIGKVHENTAPALKLLEKQGFRYRGYFDLFDGGPTVEAQLEHIATVKNSHKYQLEIGEVVTTTSHIVANCSVEHFRAMLTADLEVNTIDKTVKLNQKTCDALGLTSGDFVRVSSL